MAEPAARAMRDRLPFRAVNRRHSPSFEPGLQRHHLLPRQALDRRCFGRLFDAIGRDRIGFDDFRSNGLLLPGRDETAARIGLPLHRGPHRAYNQMVMERIGQVEAGWARLNPKAPDTALSEAVMRLDLLQRALRRRLLDPLRARFSLNRRDPLGQARDFAELDAMADALWGAAADEAVQPFRPACPVQARAWPAGKSRTGAADGPAGTGSANPKNFRLCPQPA